MDKGNRCLVRDTRTSNEIIIPITAVFCTDSSGNLIQATREDVEHEELFMKSSSNEKVQIQMIVYGGTRTELLKVVNSGTKRRRIQKKHSLTPGLSWTNKADTKNKKKAQKNLLKEALSKSVRDADKDILQRYAKSNEEMPGATVTESREGEVLPDDNHNEQEKDSHQNVRVEAPPSPLHLPLASTSAKPSDDFEIPSLSLQTPPKESVCITRSKTLIGDYSQSSSRSSSRIASQSDATTDSVFSTNRKPSDAIVDAIGGSDEAVESDKAAESDKAEESDEAAESDKAAKSDEAAESDESAESDEAAESDEEGPLNRKKIRRDLLAVRNSIVKKLKRFVKGKDKSSRPNKDGTAEIIDGVHVDVSHLMKSVEVKKMRLRANHVMRAYWPENVRRILNIRKEKHRLDRRTVTSAELKDLADICKVLQRTKKLPDRKGNDPELNMRQWVRQFLKNEHRRLSKLDENRDHESDNSGGDDGDEGGGSNGRNE